MMSHEFKVISHLNLATFVVKNYQFLQKILIQPLWSINHFWLVKKQMLQAANTDLFNPLVPKAHNSECQNPPFPFQMKPVKVS